MRQFAGHHKRARVTEGPGGTRVRHRVRSFEDDEGFDPYPTVGTVNDLTVSEEEDGLLLPDGRRIERTRRPMGFRPPETPP